METKYIVNTLAVNLFSSEYLVIAVIQLLAAHYAYLLKAWTQLYKISQTSRSDACASQV